MKHYGDITKIRGFNVEPVDVICGGSPCQDLSVAGLRKGMQHSALGDGETTRSGLFMEQIRIIKEMRHKYELEQIHGRGANESIRPGRYMVWENVYGAWSSNGGEDFRVVLEETARIKDPNAVIPRPAGGKWTPCGCIVGDGYSLAWRGHNAADWGVPQRRKRICLLADFDGDSAGRILFETELWRETDSPKTEPIIGHSGDESRSEVQSLGASLPGDFESCGAEGEGTSEGSERRSDSASFTLKIRGGR